jgi:hypothetical protein
MADLALPTRRRIFFTKKRLSRPPQALATGIGKPRVLAGGGKGGAVLPCVLHNGQPAAAGAAVAEVACGDNQTQQKKVLETRTRNKTKGRVRFSKKKK